MGNPGMCYAKLQVRHILFKKIVFLIFLNNPVTVHCARAYCLKRKKQKTFFSFQSMPNLQFCRSLKSGIIKRIKVITALPNCGTCETPA